MANGRPTLGVIIGNRGFFPDELCREGRKEILAVLDEIGIEAVVLSPEDSPFGSVESLAEAAKCGDLFKAHGDDIIGILVTLPNFGDERGVANAIRMSGLDVPVLVHAFPDEASKMSIINRRDSFCGKMSVCNNLQQYGIPYSLTSLHTMSPSSDAFKADLAWFVTVCKVVDGLKGARFGCLGARPAAFNTVRFSEKILERAGISVETLDLSEAYGRMDAMADDDGAVQAKLAEIKGYVTTKGIPEVALLKMAKFGVMMDQWTEEARLQATAVQCWTAMEEYFGVVPCTVMSMLSNSLMPSACETDITGAIGMYAMVLASGTPSALVDWNNNFGEDPDKAVLFHCSNLPRDLFAKAKMDYQEIIAGTVGKENTYGTIVGPLKPGAMTFCRVATDDEWGTIRCYIGEGRIVDEDMETFGGYGVVEIPELQDLLRYICENGFEHHTAINVSQVAGALEEALGKYLGWDVYLHNTI
jgi:L-fucose isomerase-like protein